MSNLKSRQKMLNSPSMEYRHNIIQTGRMSTKPNSTFDRDNSTVRYSKPSSVLNLPSIDLFRPRLHQLGKRSNGNRSVKKLSRYRSKISQRKKITIEDKILSSQKNLINKSLSVYKRNSKRRSSKPHKRRMKESKSESKLPNFPHNHLISISTKSFDHDKSIGESLYKAKKNKKVYDQSMGSTNDEIVQNLKKRLDYVSSLKPIIPLKNIKIRHTFDLDINMNQQKDDLIQKDWYQITEEVESNSSIDLFTSDESKKLSKGQPWSSRSNKVFAGKHIIQDYYRKSKNIKRIKEKQKVDGERKSPLIEFLSEIDTTRAYPRNLGMVNYSGVTDEDINLKSFYMGKRYANAFSKGIRDNPSLKNINISRNNLDDESLKAIIESVSDQVETIDLSNNDKITASGYQKIGLMLEDPQKDLNSLILEGNTIIDPYLCHMKDGLGYNDYLKFLNLSKNNITNKGAKILANILIMNNSLRVLFLHWNKIQPKGASAIFKALESNQVLQVLDMSFNTIGSDAEHIASKQFSQTCSENKGLLHLDLSHCNFDQEDISIISEGLKKNHTILGIHILGNKASIDAKGFVHSHETPDCALSQVFSRISPDLRTGMAKKDRKYSLHAYSNCWICEGWTEVRFEWRLNPDQSDKNKRNRIKIHLSCDNYEPDKLRKDPNDNTLYSLCRMVPPGEIKFYFTVNDVKMVSNEMEVRDAQDYEDLHVPKTNIIKNIIKKDQMITETYLTNLKAIPRPKRRAKRPRPKSPWNVNKSVFRTYQDSTDSLISRCFEFDWDCCKVKNTIRNNTERALIKKFLKQNYRALVECYRHYSAVAPSGLIPSIGTNVLGDIVNNFENELVDYKSLKLSDIDLEFISTKAGGKTKHEFIPERQLVRFQFMEVLVRISIIKYFKSGLLKTMEEAIKTCFQEHFLTYLNSFDSRTWRLTKLWTEDCDKTYKRYHSVIAKLYNKYSGKYALPGDPHYMSIDEFFELVCDTKVVNDDFGQREIGALFNLSMMLRVNEIDQDKHINMTYVEFLEGIARLATRLKIPMLVEEGSNKLRAYDSLLTSRVFSKLTDSTINSESTTASVELHFKIESMIYMMCYCCLSREDIRLMTRKVLAFHKSRLKVVKIDSEDYTSSEDEL
ncbi:unnamed protein product [Moneuplotes crassus]|uniref:Uncharacterized protein n=1 Tax=Euplotes crassus TaxID=5936 RepID=A0AAD1XCB2_EUPCR|nr:unnamed protein product [Moneuplotes crassus]